MRRQVFQCQGHHGEASISMPVTSLGGEYAVLLNATKL
eukprot:CAMPEP_0184459468 /NCGR_PEP_ID=MMETSP0740-20130409/37014_1 /TAXON_ID=385413 /ORGANISM="Thalassiosira miniscula, Strain CCMP1093" /LENGTH=37 /DNA_ID= /DNA_START= /DNA_END= /DNA_ORIENTATION=